MCSAERAPLQGGFRPWRVLEIALSSDRFSLATEGPTAVPVLNAGTADSANPCAVPEPTVLPMAARAPRWLPLIGGGGIHPSGVAL